MMYTCVLEGAEIYSKVTVMKCHVHCENSGNRKFTIIIFISSICVHVNSYLKEWKMLCFKMFVYLKGSYDIA